MGVGVSSWRLANAVSRLGELGVVSGTALDQILARRLQDGDPGGYMRRGLDRFPIRSMADRIWQTYYVPGGKAADEAYKQPPMHTRDNPRELVEICIVANFVEVTLAREGHANPVGINYLEKIQLPHLASLYGALLGGVGYVLMGAGIPLRIPGVLDRLAWHEPATYTLAVTGARPGDDIDVRFDPADYGAARLPPMARPSFLAIIASNALAVTLLRKANGRIDGFVVEGPSAGGHNAPPRGRPPLGPRGEPVYGERDRVDPAALRALGLPFWLAGGYGSPERLREALAAGAAGVQVGTAFALCRESGLDDRYRRAVLADVQAGTASVFTDPLASPTGFPFKVAAAAGTLSDEALYRTRPRICDLGYLREAYRTPAGTIGFRCPAEPPSVYVAKGGAIEETVGRKCVCNALLASIGHPQVRAHRHVEPGIVTMGDDLAGVGRFYPPDADDYTAADVVTRLRSALPSA